MTREKHNPREQSGKGRIWIIVGVVLSVIILIIALMRIFPGMSLFPVTIFEYSFNDNEKIRIVRNFNVSALQKGACESEFNVRLYYDGAHRGTHPRSCRIFDRLKFQVETEEGWHTLLVLKKIEGKWALSDKFILQFK